MERSCRTELLRSASIRADCADSGLQAAAHRVENGSGVGKPAAAQVRRYMRTIQRHGVRSQRAGLHLAAPQRELSQGDGSGAVRCADILRSIKWRLYCGDKPKYNRPFTKR